MASSYDSCNVVFKNSNNEDEANVEFTAEQQAKPALLEDSTGFTTIAFGNSAQDYSRAEISDNHLYSSDLAMDLTAPVESSPLKETKIDPFSLPRCLRHADGLCMIITSMVVFSISITIALIVQIYVGQPQVVPHGGIVSSYEFCSKLGFDLLKSSDASTVDAAILTALCLSIAHPHAAGIGGGGFCLVHNQKLVTKATKVFDFREKSSIAFSNETLRGQHFEGKSVDEISLNMTVAVPGLLKGLQSLHSAYGKTPWKKLVSRAAIFAREGVPVSDELARAIQLLDLNTVSLSLREIILRPDGISKLKEGDKLKQPKLAETLDIVADQGADALYSGSLLQQFIEAINDVGGLLTQDDMKRYKTVTSFDVNETVYSDMKVVTAGPPSSGFALHATMAAMSHYNTSDQTDSEFLQKHRLAEVIKYSLALQAQLGDPSRSTYSRPYFLNQSYNLGSIIKGEVNDSASYSLPHYLREYQPLLLTSTGQQYISLIGQDGYAVVLYMSIGSTFGSKTMASGFVLNNAMIDFSWNGRNDINSALPPSQSNYLSGGARPMSSLVPALVIPSVTKCGEYVLPGSAPGYLSLSSISQVILNNQRYSISPSIDKPRIYQQLIPEVLMLENASAPGLADFLTKRGHNVTFLRQKSSYGIVDVVEWLKDTVSAFIDKRDGRDNVAYAY